MQSVQPGPSTFPPTNARRVEMGTIMCSAALSHQIMYAFGAVVVQRHSLVATRQLAGLVDELAEMFHKYQMFSWQTRQSMMHGSTTDEAAVPSCVVMHMGFAHRAYQSVMRLVLYRIEAEASTAHHHHHHHHHHHQGVVVVLLQQANRPG